MNNITKRFVLIYGLYLGWILSFTYEGPLFNVIIQVKQYNSNLLLLFMHCAPIIIIILFIFRFVNRKTDAAWLYAVLSSSLVFSILFILFGHNVESPLHFALLIVLSVFTGLAELLFIMSSTGWYIKLVPVKYMFRAMAFITLIANTIVMACNFLIFYHLEAVSVAVSLAACLLSLILTLTLKKESLLNRPSHMVKIPPNTIVRMCAAFFLFNIGGGVVFQVINPLIIHSFDLIEIFNILPYVISCVFIIVLVKDNRENIQYFLISATGIIIIGLILFPIRRSIKHSACVEHTDRIRICDHGRLHVGACRAAFLCL